ncbi:MAG: acetate--CoA ligase family protein [Magnetococcales bacterium]|nr:acetate--CoA ligase family protein [Magnetococcales bacterium]
MIPGHSTLAPLLSPRAMVIVGASRQTEKFGHVLLANFLSGSFAGKRYLLHPSGEEILGQPALTNWNALPRGVDLALLAVPAPLVVEQARQAALRGCSALVVISNGFAEDDEAGKQRKTALVRLCKERGMLLLGPASPGVIHRQAGINASLAPVLPPEGGISLLAGSGELCIATLAWMASRNLGLAKMIGPGNGAGLSDAQCLAWLAHDPDTRVIACQLQRLGAGLLKAASEAAQLKPVVLLPPDTGYDPQVINAACDRMGVLRAHGIQEWWDLLLACARNTTLPAGNRVMILTDHDTLGRHTAVTLERHGLTATDETPGDALLTLVAPPRHDLAETVRPELPHLMVLPGAEEHDAHMQAADRAGIAAYPTPERAAAVLASLETFIRQRQRPARVITPLPVNPTRAARLLQRHPRQAEPHPLSDAEAKPILQAYGLAVPEGEITSSEEGALEIAERLGYPVSLHLLTPDGHLVHGMPLRHDRLADPQAVRDAFDLLTLRFMRLLPTGRVEGVFVEQACGQGRPVRVTMRRDPALGPLLTLENGACQLAPVTEEEAMAMARAGTPASARENDTRDLAEILQRLGQLAGDFPEIERIEIDPLVIRRAGQSPVVATCAILLNAGGKPP